MVNETKAELESLYAEIKKIYQSFRQIRGEAEGILETCEMPDSKSQLGDVLASTENATVTIITHVSAIQEIVSESALADDAKEAVGEHVMQVFEACGFQDISGQRINKVMERLHTLEEQLMRLSAAGSGKPLEPTQQKKTRDPLLNGPQLSTDAPDQEAINRLFDEDN